MSALDLEQALRDLPRRGTLIKDRPYRQVWRFEFGGAYYLKFYPCASGRLKRLIRGNPAWREFTRLQLLQKAQVPSPRAIAQLSGYVLNGVKGDAVLIEAIEPAVQLDQYLADFALRGEAIPRRRELADQLVMLVRKLGLAGLGHSDLHLGNLLSKDGNLYLLDGYAVRRGGLRRRDVMGLAHSAGAFATRADLVRAWRALGGGGRVPSARNAVRWRQWRKAVARATGENRSFGRVRIGAWAGVFFRQWRFSKRWAPASRLEATLADWQREWPNLWGRIEADQLDIIKRGESGDVLAGQIVLGGHPVEVIVKRSRRRKWYRYFNEVGRGSRAQRAWKKAWSLVARDVPTAWPLLLMERRRFGYVTDSLIVCERVRGQVLADINLEAMQPARRQTLLRRLGRTLRQLEATGLRQYDSKSSNWIIVDDDKCGPTPAIVDVDGIRRWTPPMWPIERLLHSMRQHPQYTAEDSRELCLGYAPYARVPRQD